MNDFQVLGAQSIAEQQQQSKMKQISVCVCVEQLQCSSVWGNTQCSNSVWCSTILHRNHYGIAVQYGTAWFANDSVGDPDYVQCLQQSSV